jgi:hypothetical protein
MPPLLLHVLPAGSVAALASDTQDHVVAPVLVGRAGDVGGPGVMALHAARGGLAWLDAVHGVAPTAEGIQPGDGKVVQPIPLPGEIHLIGLAPGAVDQGDPVLPALHAPRRDLDGCGEELVSRARHLEMQLRVAAGMNAAARSEARRAHAACRSAGQEVPGLLKVLDAPGMALGACRCANVTGVHDRRPTVGLVLVVIPRPRQTRPQPKSERHTGREKHQERKRDPAPSRPGPRRVSRVRPDSRRFRIEHWQLPPGELTHAKERRQRLCPTRRRRKADPGGRDV